MWEMRPDFSAVTPLKLHTREVLHANLNLQTNGPISPCSPSVKTSLVLLRSGHVLDSNSLAFLPFYQPHKFPELFALLVKSNKK